MKTQSKEKQALLVANDDAEYILEPLVDSLLASGLTAAQVSDGLAASSERIMRVSLTDKGMPVSPRDGVQLRTTTVQAEARRVAAKLIQRLTVKNPDAVLPASKRHGQPAAVAA